MLILHIDMDSYFASVEQQANPRLRGKAIVVSGRPDIHSVVAAASREAKRYGVRAGMTTWEAKRLCPHVIFVAGNPDKYLSLTRRFFHILLRYTPMVEMFSIDEAFLDISQEAALHGGAIAMGKRIQQDFRSALGEWVTCSIGIAENKMLAKLAVEEAKPAGIRWFLPEEILGILEKTSLQTVCGIGPRIARRLEHLGILKLADLGRFPEAILRREFGVYGTTLALWGRGLDPTPLIPYWQVEEVKSVGHSHAVPKNLRNPEGARGVLLFLCEGVGRRLRAKGLAARVVHFALRDADMRFHGGQRALETPTDDEEAIFRAALDLCASRGGFPDETTLLAVRATGVIPKEETVRPLFLGERRRERLEQAVDRIRDRYGDRAIWRGSVFASCRHLTQATGGLGQQKEIVLAEKVSETEISSQERRRHERASPYPPIRWETANRRG
jgi:DNA polymerase-4